MLKKDSANNSLKSELHKDHRKRLKSAFRKNGLNSFHEHNILEMLLFYSIPRCDTNETSHMLLNEFGSFQAVFEASIESLESVEGVGPETATFIRFIGELFSYFEFNKIKECKHIRNSQEAYEFLKKYYLQRGPEKFVTVFLNGRCEILSVYEVTQNAESYVYADFNTILQKAVLLQAKGIVIAHNHDYGFSTPSAEDKILTEKLSKLCNTLGIILCEHIIFSYGMDPTFLSKVKAIKKGTLAF